MTQFFVFIHKLPNCQKKKKHNTTKPQKHSIPPIQTEQGYYIFEDFHTLFDPEITVLIVQNVLH